MKKIAILVMLISFTVASAQGDFNKWTIGLETGLHSVSDETATAYDNYGYYGANVRYNVNEVFGIGFSGGFNDLTLKDMNNNIVSLDYSRIDFEATISLFEILRLRHKYINFQAHGGAGLARIDTDNNYKEDIMNVTGGLTGLVKLSRSMALTVGYRTSVHINQELTLDGSSPITNSGVNSTIDNLTVGLNFYLGNKGRQHADFYVAPEPEYNVYVTKQGDVINNYQTVVENIVKAANEAEYVFFDHDKYVVNRDGLNAVTRSADKVTSDSKVYVIGSASPPGVPYYNLKLSENRAEAVVSKLISQGVPSNQIVIEYVGEIDTNDSKNVDLSRRVKIVVVNK